MYRRLAPFLPALLLLACGPEAPPAPRDPTATAPTAPEPRRDPPPPASAPPPTASAPASTSAPAPPRFVMRELAPTQGELLALLKEEAARAKEKSLVPIVEFYAPWCPPCRVFHENMHKGPIAAALQGHYLVKLDLDDWHDQARKTPYWPKKIPAFFFVGDDGQPRGKMLDGDGWKKASPEAIGQSLKTFLQAKP